MNKRKYLIRSVLISIITLFLINQLTHVSNKPEDRDSIIKEEIEKCKKGIKEKYGKLYDSIFDASVYCDCILTKFKESSPEEIQKSVLAISDPNSTIFNEILIPCAQDAFIYQKESKNIFGFLNKDTIKVTQTALGLKIKVQVGKTEYYFILDSGASELFISNKIYQEYLRNNPQMLVRELASQVFQMANGTTQLCKRVEIDKVNIGKFIIPNVTFAITPKDCTPLLGQNVLSRFSSWSVIENNTKVVFIR